MVRKIGRSMKLGDRFRTAAMIGSGLLLYVRARAGSRIIEDAQPGLLGSLAN